MTPGEQAQALGLRLEVVDPRHYQLWDDNTGKVSDFYDEETLKQFLREALAKRDRQR